MHYHQQRLRKLFGLSLVFLLGLSSCTDEHTTAPMTYETAYVDSMPYSSSSVTYLVSDVPDQYPGTQADPLLRNAWGLAMSPSGMFWVAAEASGYALAYDMHGYPMHPAVKITNRTGDGPGAPTGVAFNTTSGFVIPEMGPAQVLFASADGSISAWAGGEKATVVASSSGDAEYTGLALISNPRGESYLYAADFKGGKIDVYDKNFAPVSGMSFTYPGMEPGYAPYNVVALGRVLLVAYAKRGADGEEVRSPGAGFVNMYSMRGAFIRRLAWGPQLNAPWGIAAQQTDPYMLYTKLYIANFGDGTISTYDQDGNFIGMLLDAEGTTVQVDGLWGIAIANPATSPGIDANSLWFAAGPNGETNGTFGYIKLQ